MSRPKTNTAIWGARALTNNPTQKSPNPQANTFLTPNASLRPPARTFAIKFVIRAAPEETANQESAWKEATTFGMIVVVASDSKAESVIKMTEESMSPFSALDHASARGRGDMTLILAYFA